MALRHGKAALWHLLGVLLSLLRAAESSWAPLGAGMSGCRHVWVSHWLSQPPASPGCASLHLLPYNHDERRGAIKHRSCWRYSLWQIEEEEQILETERAVR